MKKILILFLSMFLFIACSEKTPDAVAKDFIQNLYDNKIDNVMKYFEIKERDVATAKGKLLSMSGELQARINSYGEGLKSLESKIIEQNDNRALVKVIINMKNGKTKYETIRLYKKENKWYISL